MKKGVLITGSVIVLITINAYLPELAADLTAAGVSSFWIHPITPIAGGLALALNALDPLGRIRRKIEGIDVSIPTSVDKAAVSTTTVVETPQPVPASAVGTPAVNTSQ